MACLCADEDFSHLVVEELRRLGHDVVTAQEAGQANRGIADEQVLTFAVARQRAVMTFNRRDFVRLHSRGLRHSGIVICSRDSDAVSFANRIDVAVRESNTLENRLIRVNRPQDP